MKNAIKIRVCLCFIVVAIALLAMTDRVTSVRSASQPPSPTTSCEDGDDDAKATCLFAALTAASTTWRREDTTSKALAQPAWTTWNDKCSLSLTSCPPDITNARSRTSNADLRALSSAIQITQLLASGSGEHPFSKFGKNRLSQLDHLQRHELASVLFSDELSSTIKNNGLSTKDTLNAQLRNVASKTGMAREIETQLTLGSTAVKLIWEVALAKGTPNASNYPVRVYEPVADAANGGQATPRQGTSSQLDSNMQHWASAYLLTDTPTCEDPAPSFTSGGPTPLSVNCFYNLKVNTTDTGIMNQLTSDASDVINNQDLQGQNVYIVLVGAHIARFDQQHPAWQWMTFYWQRTPNTVPGWKNPWKHYHMMTASSPKDGVAIKPTTIANPYLEGHIDTNGLTSNCATCHSLAAYSRKGGKVNQAVPLAEKYPTYPDAETGTEGTRYFKDAVRTHFLWSLATNNQLPQPANPSLNDLEKEIRRRQ
jgi:hypothetical protein